MHTLNLLCDLIDASPLYRRIIKEDRSGIYIGVGNVLNKRMIAICFEDNYTGRRIGRHEVFDVMEELGERLA